MFVKIRKALNLCLYIHAETIYLSVCVNILNSVYEYLAWFWTSTGDLMYSLCVLKVDYYILVLSIKIKLVFLAIYAKK